MVLGCLASWAVNVLFQWDALPFYLVHILVWFLSDWIMLSVVQVKLNHIHMFLLYNNLSYFLPRMDLYHLISSTLSSDGYSANLLDHIYFYVHYLIRRYDGVRGLLSFIGVALHMRRN